MDDASRPQMSDTPDTQSYPQYRFTSLLILLIVLVAIIAVAQQWSLEALEEPALDQAILQGDISIKMAYSLGGWTNSVKTDIRSKDVFERQARLFERSAVTAYTRAARKRKSVDAMRRLIILGPSEDRHTYIEWLASAHQIQPSEVQMWRVLYVEHGPVTRKSLTAYSTIIRGLDLRWFEHLALADLYRRSGMADRANLQIDYAIREAQRTTVGFTVLIALVGILGILGVGIVALYVTRILVGSRRLTDLPMSENVRQFKSGVLLQIFIVYLLIWGGTQFVGGLLVGTISVSKYHDVTELEIYTAAASYILGGILAVGFLARKLRAVDWPFETIGLTGKGWRREVLVGVAGYGASLPLLFIAALVTQLITGPGGEPSNQVIPLIARAEGFGERLVLFLLVGVAAPFFEEIFFRGVLLNSFRARWTPVIGIVLSAGTFAMLHPLIGFLPIFALGSVFAVLLYERKSLVSPMIAHSISNMVTFLILVLLVGS